MPITTPGGALQTVNVTAPKITDPTAPVVPITTPGGGVQTVNVTAPKITDPTAPVVPVTTPGGVLQTITVTAPPVVPPTPPLIPLTPITTPSTYVAPVVTPPQITVPPTVVPPTPPVVVIPPKVVANTTPVTKTVTTPTFGTPQTVNSSGLLNPGWIAPDAFYHTTDPAQAQFYWGQHPTQYDPAFSSATYNNVPNAPATPWGLQQLAKPLTSQQIAGIVANPHTTTPTTAPAAYTPQIANWNHPTTGQTGPVGVTVPTIATKAISPYTPATAGVDQYAPVNAALGQNWQFDQQRAASQGDWTTYNTIQSKVDAILNPPATPVKP